MELQEIEKAAHWYINQGLYVLPLMGKVPLTQRGLYNATNDPANVSRWWKTWRDANVGVLTGTVSGIWVLDIDGQEGLSTIKSLISEKGRGFIEGAPIVGTGKGYHIYYKDNNFRNTAKKLPGIDSRGEGGYVVVPPSIHPDTNIKYKWLTQPNFSNLFEPPKWLIERLSGDKTTLKNNWEDICKPINIGSRNETLTKVAGALLRGKVEETLAYSLLLCYNKCYFNPPLEKSEIDVIFKSILAKETFNANRS
jgi:hypothetical protein